MLYVYLYYVCTYVRVLYIGMRYYSVLHTQFSTAHTDARYGVYFSGERGTGRDDSVAKGEWLIID